MVTSIFWQTTLFFYSLCQKNQTMDVNLTCPFFCWETPGVDPQLSSCEWCCSKHMRLHLCKANTAGGIARSRGSSIFSFLRNFHTDSQSGWTSFYSHQQRWSSLCLHLGQNLRLLLLTGVRRNANGASNLHLWWLIIVNVFPTFTGFLYFTVWELPLISLAH